MAREEICQVVTEFKDYHHLSGRSFRVPIRYLRLVSFFAVLVLIWTSHQFYNRDILRIFV
jgi:hypothetical protein